MLIHTNQPLITSFYMKKVPIFCRISDESALIRNFLRNGRVRVRKYYFFSVRKFNFRANNDSLESKIQFRLDVDLYYNQELASGWDFSGFQIPYPGYRNRDLKIPKS